MNQYIGPILILIGFIVFFLVISFLNHKTEAPEEIEFIDCENCGNIKCTMRKQNYLVRKGEQDPNCHYMPYDKMK